MRTLLALLLMLLSLSACGNPAGVSPTPSAPPAPTSEQQEESPTMVYAKIGSQTLTILLEDNSSAKAFAALLAQGDLTVDMADYGGFEKVGSLGTTLPTNDTRITTEPGDVILYQGNSITIYYDTNTWNFTKLGKIQSFPQEALKAILGQGDLSVTFSVDPD